MTNKSKSSDSQQEFKVPPAFKFQEGEKVLCFHGPLIYEAKCLQSRYDDEEKMNQYHIHYSGWNKSWDEWVPETRVLKFNDGNLQRQKELHKAQKAEPKGKKGKKRNVPGKEKDGEGKEKEADDSRSSTPVNDRGGGKASASATQSSSQESASDIPKRKRSKLDPSVETTGEAEVHKSPNSGSINSTSRSRKKVIPRNPSPENSPPMETEPSPESEVQEKSPEKAKAVTKKEAATKKKRPALSPKKTVPPKKIKSLAKNIVAEPEDTPKIKATVETNGSLKTVKSPVNAKPLRKPTASKPNAASKEGKPAAAPKSSAKLASTEEKELPNQAGSPKKPESPTKMKSRQKGTVNSRKPSPRKASPKKTPPLEKESSCANDKHQLSEMKHKKLRVKVEKLNVQNYEKLPNPVTNGVSVNNVVLGKLRGNSKKP